MAGGPEAVVPAPPAAPPRVGLLVSARRPTDDDTRWVNGFRYDPEHPGLGYITSVCDPTASDRDLDTNPGDVDWTPYVVGDGVKCSSFGFTSRDWDAQARRAVEAITEYRLSRELWTGEQAQAESLPNRWLADVANVDIVTESGPVDAVQALACLEQYLADTIAGRRGMIHATWATVTWWMRFGLVRRDTGLLLSALDTIIVPGAGYDGSTPDGAPATNGDVWAYATDLVDVRLGPIEIIGGLNATGVNRTTNTVEIRAERAAAASWELAAHGGARIDLNVCDIGGS